MLVLIIGGAAKFSLDNWIASSFWFVTFFWIPVWTAAYLIATLRRKGIERTVLEWLILVVCMALGNSVTDLLNHYVYQIPRMGLFVIANGVWWGSILYFATRFYESRRKIAKEKAFRKRAQLESLRYQLNPHFMFNSLNTISAYIHSNPELADEVLHELADILRYSLDTAAKQRVPLEQELNIINKYLNIEKARFGDNLTVNIDIDEALKNISIPPLLIQPVIENAIKHNQFHQQLTINLAIKSYNDKMQIEICDNGDGFPKEVLARGFGQGVGMKNLKQRVEQLKQGNITLTNNQGAQVLLEMAL